MLRYDSRSYNFSVLKKGKKRIFGKLWLTPNFIFNTNPFIWCAIFQNDRRSVAVISTKNKVFVLEHVFFGVSSENLIETFLIYNF
jgi:hypothetical protein